jgi:hypothetical protein
MAIQRIGRLSAGYRKYGYKADIVVMLKAYSNKVQISAPD